MNGIVLGMAMLVSSTVGAPAVETAPATVVPVAFSFDLPDGSAAPDVPRRLLDEEARRVWRTSSPPPAQDNRAKRLSMTDRIIAVGAGVCVGWVVGGGIGARITQTSNPYDDTSGLKGMIIGAPIGAAAGAILGWRLTK